MVVGEDICSFPLNIDPAEKRMGTAGLEAAFLVFMPWAKSKHKQTADTFSRYLENEILHEYSVTVRANYC